MKPAARPLEPGVVHLWVARESQLDPSMEARYRELMSAEERESERRFLVEGARRLHVLARGLQRTVLASCLPGVVPAELKFLKGASGRPALAPPFDASDVDFNLAHTAGMVVMAVGVGIRPGVDVERMAKDVPLAAARRYFSIAEVAALDALPAEEQPARFLELWTLKEAYLKAIGTGIAGGLGSMTFHLQGDMCRFERAADPDAARWQFGQYAVGADHLVALACPPAPRALEVEWREFHAGEERPVSAQVAGVRRSSGQEQRAQP